MSDDLRLWLALAFVGLGSSVMAIGVYGIVWLPDVYTKLHAASKAVVLGVIPFLVAVMIVGDGEMIARAILITVFLLTTAPVSSHAIGRAAYLTDERRRSPSSTAGGPPA